MIKLTQKEFYRISSYVRMHYGINLEKKQFLIESKLWIELAKCKVDNYTDYWNKVRSDNTGQLEQRMIDLLTTNYTYFCREEAHFSFLVQTVLPKLAKSTCSSLNIWCAACATGQECYTLSMYLSDAQAMGHLRIPFHILGTDISKKALDAAKKASYGSNDYARLSAHWKGRYCTPFQDGAFFVKGTVKNHVTFQRHNLLKPLTIGGPFQIIFCRNVLIYFKEPERNQLISCVGKSLLPGGYLFTSHTEILPDSREKFQYIQPAVYQKPGELK